MPRNNQLPPSSQAVPPTTAPKDQPVPPPVNDDPVINDPMAEFLTPGATYKSPDEDDTAPDELLAIFDEFDIGRRTYSCMLKGNSGDVTNNAYIKNFSSCYPSIDWIARNCGPGEYLLKFSWRCKSDGKLESFNKMVPITISDRCADEYADFQLATRLERMKKNRSKVQNAALEKVLESQFADLGLTDKQPEAVKPVNPLEHLDTLSASVTQIAKVAESLGMTRKDTGNSWLEKMTPLLMASLPGIMKWFMDSQNRRADETKQMYALLLSTATNSNQQLVELFKNQQGPGTGNQIMKEMADMIRAAMDIKSMMQPEKESLADKIFNMIEAFAPAIVSVMAVPKAARAIDPRVAAAKAFVNNSPEFQQAIHDPTQWKALITRLDTFFGWEQADVIIDVMGLQRPVECPKEDNKRYPAGDPRNGPEQVETTEAETTDTDAKA